MFNVSSYLVSDLTLNCSLAQTQRGILVKIFGIRYNKGMPPVCIGAAL